MPESKLPDMEQAQGKVLAFDFGGTKLAAAIVDKSTGEITHYLRRSTPQSATFEKSLEAILQMGDAILEDITGEEIQAVCVSFGGPISADSQMVITSQHVAGWNHYPLPKVLSEHYQLPAYMENDANAAALGEWFFGAGKQLDSMFYVQVSTGIGAGIIINRKIYRGKGLAGEFGHMTVEEDGLRCACGKSGCLESYSSGWGIATQARAIFDKLPQDSVLRTLCQNDPDKISTKLVFDSYRQNDPQAIALVSAAIRSLSRALADAACLLDPHRIVIGGGVSNSKEIIQAEMAPYLEKFVPGFLAPQIEIHFSVLDGKETLLGAALLSEEKYR